MSKSSTYLQLAPEMGGIRFGPFQGPVQVGSDPQRNQLVLDPAHGIYPTHATVVETAAGVFTVAPAQQGCQVFLVPQGQHQVWPVRAPAQARAGDQVVFGTPAGPRFMLLWEGPQEKRSAAQLAAQARTGERGFVQAASGALDNLFSPVRGRGISGEIARRSRSRMLTKSPWRELYAFHVRWRTGSFRSPVYIVSALTAAGGVLVGGGATCSGVLWAAWQAIVR